MVSCVNCRFQDERPRTARIMVRHTGTGMLFVIVSLEKAMGIQNSEYRIQNTNELRHRTKRREVHPVGDMPP